MNPERIVGIINFLKPKTKRELRKFGGLAGYCRLWVGSYAQKTESLSSELFEVSQILSSGPRGTADSRGIKALFSHRPSPGTSVFREAFSLVYYC